MIAVQALGFHGAFHGDYILSKFLLRDEVNFTVAVGLQAISDQKIKSAFFAASTILIRGSNLYLILLSTTKRTLFRAWQLVEIG